MAIIVVVISSVRRVITNDQGLTGWSLLYISSTFLNIFAVPNNAVFCITPTSFVIDSFSIDPSRAYITTSSTSTIFSFHNLQSFSWRPGVFYFLSFIFLYFYISCYSNISYYPLHSFLPIKVISDLLPLSLCHAEHRYPTTLSLLHFLSLFLGRVHTIFPSALAHSSNKDFNGVSLLHFRVISYILYELLSCIHFLNVAHFNFFFT